MLCKIYCIIQSIQKDSSTAHDKWEALPHRTPWENFRSINHWSSNPAKNLGIDHGNFLICRIVTAHTHFWRGEQEANLPSRQESGIRSTVASSSMISLYGLISMLSFSFSCVNVAFSLFFCAQGFFLFVRASNGQSERVCNLIIEQDGWERPKGKRNVYKRFGRVGFVVPTTCRLLESFCCLLLINS